MIGILMMKGAVIALESLTDCGDDSTLLADPRTDSAEAGVGGNLSCSCGKVMLNPLDAGIVGELELARLVVGEQLGDMGLIMLSTSDDEERPLTEEEEEPLAEVAEPFDDTGEVRDETVSAASLSDSDASALSRSA
jgi:hypothetical protein